jgi:hypothetical protein
VVAPLRGNIVRQHGGCPGATGWGQRLYIQQALGSTPNRSTSSLSPFGGAEQDLTRPSRGVSPGCPVQFLALGIRKAYPQFGVFAVFWGFGRPSHFWLVFHALTVATENIRSTPCKNTLRCYNK